MPASEILQVRVGEVVFQIIPCQIVVSKGIRP